MERESLLLILILLLGGAAVQSFASWPAGRAEGTNAAERERRAWLALWMPVVPALTVAAWLCGWALREPDPVPDPLGRWVLAAACAPFALVSARAMLRAVWSLLRKPDERAVATVGLIRPRAVFPPLLAKGLDHAALRAALEHERAHIRHRDPLRIWLAQFVTDLQWPWPSAHKRLQRWLSALEYARDDEARARGAEGADLAAAILAAVRFRRSAAERAPALRAGRRSEAYLVGAAGTLRQRVARLLEPLPTQTRGRRSVTTSAKAELLLIPVLLSSLLLGALVGERILHGLLALT